MNAALPGRLRLVADARCGTAGLREGQLDIK